MRVNVNHPSFISFLDNVTNTILSNVPVEDYFQLTQEKKLALQFTVLKLMKNSVKLRAKLTDLELRSFVIVLCKKNEESENYEIASILNDISTNFDTINDVTKIPKRTTRRIKSNNE
jgi:hypothetical protein